MRGFGFNKFNYSLWLRVSVRAILLLLVLAACDLNPPLTVGKTEAPKGSNNNNGPQKQFYTVVLEKQNDSDGVTVSLKNVRSLSKDAAQMGHEFFEVVFLYNMGTTGSPDYKTARVSWDLGYPTGIGGVYRTADGTDYSGLTDKPAGGMGSAVMFVGKKDKTLLGVGRLAFVDGAAGATITSESKTVTFEVAALKAGVSYTAANSSFLTNALTTGSAVSVPGTSIESGIKVHQKEFPLFKLAKNSVTLAEYTFALEGGLPWSTFQNRLVRVPLSPATVERRDPRYLITDGHYQISSYLVNDYKTVIKMTNNYPNDSSLLDNPPPPAAAYFENPVQFEFNTAATLDGHVFALVFSVPVYALNGADGSGGNKAIVWNIRPGYDQYWLDLDDGRGGTGGAVFIGTGNVAGYLP